MTPKEHFCLESIDMALCMFLGCCPFKAQAAEDRGDAGKEKRKTDSVSIKLLVDRDWKPVLAFPWLSSVFLTNP